MRVFKNESAFKEAIIAHLRASGFLAWRVGAALYGSAGWPDIQCVLKGGTTLYIEAKQPKKKPTKLQQLRMNELDEHEALVFWTDGWDDYLAKLKAALLFTE